MFELFGLLPIVKILILTIILVYSSFLIGGIMVGSTSNNKGLYFFIGLVLILSGLAIYITKGLTVFTPTLVTLFLLFKPKFNLKKIEWNVLLVSAFHFLGIFLVFLFIELFRQSYFSKNLVNSSFGDYQFYANTAQYILEYGIESSLAYLGHYNITTATNIYHYFDLYLLIPVLYFKISPLIGYLFFLNPMIYSLAVYSLINIGQFQGNKIVITTFAILALHVVGIDFNDFNGFEKLTAVHYPKSCLMIPPLLFLRLKNIWSFNKVLVAATFISLMLNPLIFIIIGASSLVVFFVYKKNLKVKFIDFFKGANWFIYIAFAIYFMFVFTSKSDNSVLVTFMEKPTLMDFVNGVINRFVGYSGVIKNLIIVILLSTLLINRLYLTKKIRLELVFVTIAFALGHLVNSLMYNHYEAMQFFNITIVLLIIFYFYYAVQNSDLRHNIVQRVGFWVVIICMLGTFIISSFTIFTKPRANFMTSLSYNALLKESLIEKENVNALYFRDYQKDTHWIYTIPYLTYGAGYLNLYSKVNCIMPTDPNMFLDNSLVKQNAVNLISKGPFSIYCKENGLAPASFYDESFEKAVKGFINLHKINLLIFDKEMTIPDWVKTLKPIKIIQPELDQDRHRAVVL